MSTTLCLFCYVLGENPNNIFHVDIDNSATISRLRDMIKVKKSNTFENVDANKFRLWKVSIAADAILGIDAKTFEDDESLQPLSKLSKIFSGPLAEERVHILIRRPEAPLPHRTLKRARESNEADLERKILHKIARRAPSSLARPSEFKKCYRDIVCLNRPFEFDTIPISLFQKEFGQFQDDCELAPSVKAQRLLQALTVVACEWHEDEKARRSKVQMVFADEAQLDLATRTIIGTDYRTDMNMDYSIMPSVIREAKNEQGCAQLEAIGYYVQFLVKKLTYRGTRFPCILFVDIGPYIGFYGALWTGERVFVEPLTPLYDLTTHWTNESHRRRIASALDAFLGAIPRLQAHYQQVPALVPLNRTYPYKRDYQDENGQVITFEYMSRLGELVFSATTGTDNLCIKFTRRYSEEAHNFLARLGHAPKLRTVIDLPGGWKMIVMDWSCYSSLYCSTLSFKAQLNVQTKVGEVVDKLHKHGFVHGDIRLTNILLNEEKLANNEECLIHLIDFDWAGRIGEVVYPMRVNMTTVRRPEGAFDRAPITIDHDQEMVSLLFSNALLDEV